MILVYALTCIVTMVAFIATSSYSWPVSIGLGTLASAIVTMIIALYVLIR